VSDEQFLTSPFLPARFHLFSHQLKYFEGALWAPLGPPGPGTLAPATARSRWAWLRSSGYHVLNFVAIDLQMYEILKIAQVSFFCHTVYKV